MPYSEFDPYWNIWPDDETRRVILAPVRVGMDRRTGRIIVGWTHVVQSMGVIFATRFHERVLRRWVGSFVPHLLGDSATERVITRFYWAICSAIDIWEPNYSILRVRVSRRALNTGEQGGGVEQELTSADELRKGELMTRNEGVYRPRGHLGDPTPEQRRELGLVGRGFRAWEAVP